jgi:hypothetical protein
VIENKQCNVTQKGWNDITKSNRSARAEIAYVTYGNNLGKADKNRQQ